MPILSIIGGLADCAEKFEQFGYAQLFGSLCERGVEFQFFFRIDSRQIVSEGLSFLPETRRGEGEEGFRFFVVGFGSWGEADYSGVYLWRRAEGSWRHGEEVFRAGEVLAFGREIAEVSCTGFRRDSLGYFFLDQENGLRQRAWVGQVF